VWAADGQCLHYANLSSRTTTPGYNRVRMGSGQIQHLFTIPNANEYATDMGPWSGVTPDDSMMYTRDASSQNAYQLDVDFP